jgi:hypothetical protein
MKNIACLAICKNEEHNIDEFVSNGISFGISDFFILDTGSNDQTMRKLKSHSVVHSFQKEFLPFDFSQARNYLKDKVPGHFSWYLHLDLDERISKLPNLNHVKNSVISGVRKESIYQTISKGLERLTPDLNYHYIYPVHEKMTHQHKVYVTEDFEILHVQKEHKDRYEDLTELHYQTFPENLFYHYILDLFRQKNYKKLIEEFLIQKEKDFFKFLSDHQKWQVVRNYQLSKIAIGQEPDRNYFQIFLDNPSSSSYYYLSLFHSFLKNPKMAHQYFRLADNVKNLKLNEQFFNRYAKRLATEFLPLDSANSSDHGTD